MSEPRPPRIPERWLHTLLDERSREAVLGDLHEGFSALRRARGAGAARRWYWLQATRSVIACRITGRRQHQSRRYDFESAASVSLRDLLGPAFRQFRDHPLYSLASTATLALAVAVACVSFTLVKQAFIDPLPYRDGHELVSLMTRIDGASSPVSPHVLEDLRGSGPPLVQFAPIRPGGAAYASTDATESISITAVNTDYFALLGVSPSLGRLWSPQEPNAVVISAGFWRDQLGQDPNVIGTAIVIDERPRTIVGVMPAGFVPPYFLTTAAWVPIDMATLLADIRTRRTLDAARETGARGIAGGPRVLFGVVLETRAGALPANAWRTDLGGDCRCETSWLDRPGRRWSQPPPPHCCCC